MANASITTYAGLLSPMGLDTVAHTASATAAFQDDIIFELAAGAKPGILVQVSAEFIATTANTAVYSIPTSSGAVVPLMLFFDDRQLAFIRRDEAWSFDPEWRTTPTARPFGYLLDAENRTQFAVVPPPTSDGETIGGSTPLTGAFPSGNVGIVFARFVLTFSGSNYRDLFLPIALEVLSREFAMDSDHRDDESAKVAHTLAEVFFKLSFPEAP